VVPGYEPTPDITTTLDVPHPPAWGWHVWAYLVTKNVAAGAALVAPFLGLLGVTDGFARDCVPEIVALVFLAITNLLLVHDLGRPGRAWRLLLKPNTKSWLVKGAWILTGFGILTLAALLLRLAGLDQAADAVRWLNIPAATFAAGYSAFLFKQCRGRDLWLEPGLFAQLVARAALMGSGLVLLLPQDAGRGGRALLLFAALVVVNAVLAAWDRLRKPGSADAARARAGLPDHFAPALMASLAALALAGTLVLAALPMEISRLVVAIPASAALAAIVLHEICWIRAGQEVPLS
jgi:formate-dependent nitrite reductase membrane component NrfD